MDTLKALIREVPDFPKPGINFFDITTLLKDPQGLRSTLDAFGDLFDGEDIDKVVGIESRGFIVGPTLACRFNAGFVPVRKPGKLPADTISEEYVLEYGTDTLEMHRDAIAPGERVLIVDDLIATGGTAQAVAKLVSATGGAIAAFGFVIELDFLNGREKLAGHTVKSLLHY
ncbi:MAG: adenine phosphoribosyltransferase [Acidobacteriota bacterium]